MSWSISPTAKSCAGRWKSTELPVFDTNVLVYAVNKDSAFHLPCRRRLDAARQAPSPAFLTWGICYEFLRVSTHPRVLQSPLRPRDAERLIFDLLASPSFELLVATPRHAAVLAQTLSELPHIRGNAMHDLHTAVLMREHGVSRICTRDADFHRFPFLTVVDPLR